MDTKLWFTCFGVLLNLTVPVFAQNTVLTPSQKVNTDDNKKVSILERLFRKEAPYAKLVSQQFARALPEEALHNVLGAPLGKPMGTFIRCQKSPEANQYEAIFSNGTEKLVVFFGSNTEITGLQVLGTMMNQVSNSLALIQELTPISPNIQFSLFVSSDSMLQEKLSVNPHKIMSVGSAFKLAVLKVVKEQVQQKKLNWTQTVFLSEENMSLPSGFLHTWPKGTALTVESLAHLMISISDNTATDHLISLVGRDAVEQISSKETWPFLKTKEMFWLKIMTTQQERTIYEKADVLERRKILTKISAIDKNRIENFSSPIAVDTIEWRFSTENLCSLLADVAALPSVHINTGIIDDSNFDIAFKGGSEPGVLNLTTFLHPKKGGKKLCVSATWNSTTETNFENFIYRYKEFLKTLIKEQF